MKLYVLYRPNSEYARQVEEFIHDFTSVHPDRQLETIDLNTREGAGMATLYDVVSYPAILATANDGQLLKSWEGPELPLMDELAYYAHD